MRPAYFLTITTESDTERAELFPRLAELFGFGVVGADFVATAGGCFMANYSRSAAELSDMREKLPQLSRLIPSACINWEE